MAEDASGRDALVRWFADVRGSDRPEVGGKCASLGELTAAGVAVPDGFAVTVRGYELLRDAGGLRGKLWTIVHGVDAGSPAALAAAQAEAVGLIRSTPMPAAVVAAVRSAYAELCERHGGGALPVAVRSSAVAEDGERASFAGQQETRLWVVGADAVVEAVRDCWASLYTPQSIAYRSRLDYDTAIRASMTAVGVQLMVDAVVSGVVFTVSPRTGDRSVVAVNASWGLGQAVVAGEVTPDEYWVSKIGPELTSSTIAHKAVRCVPAPDGRGVVDEPVPADLQDVACLDSSTLFALVDLALRVEKHYACPQDIEWALARPAGAAADGRAADGPALLLLQSRPETTWRRRSEDRRRKASTMAPSYLGVIQQIGTIGRMS
jgi:pyruvate,water dikinase